MKQQMDNRYAITMRENAKNTFRVMPAIREARRMVVIETFIIFDDSVGRSLQQAVIEAASRGVRVDIAVDGYGTADLSPSFIGAMTSAGVGFHVFDPQPRRFGVRTNLFCRLHRKIVVVDGEIAFVGGLHYGATI